MSNIETQLKQFDEETPKSPTSPTSTESHPKQLSYHDNSQSNDSINSSQDPEFIQVRLKKVHNAQVDQEIQEAAKHSTSQSDLSKQEESQSDSSRQEESQSKPEHEPLEIVRADNDLISFENIDNNNEVKESSNQNETFASKYVLKSSPKTDSASHLLDMDESSTTWTPEEDMPSVKNLLSKFNQSQTEEEDDAFNLKRVSFLYFVLKTQLHWALNTSKCLRSLRSTTFRISYIFFFNFKCCKIVICGHPLFLYCTWTFFLFFLN